MPLPSFTQKPAKNKLPRDKAREVLKKLKKIKNKTLWKSVQPACRQTGLWQKNRSSA
jgi:hypothetical protein